MKYQAFFFLLIFSFTTHAMDRVLAISRLTSEQIVGALKSYSALFLQGEDKEKMESEITRIRKTPLTLEDKKEIVAKMEQFPRPKVTIIGDRVFCFESDSNYESKSHDSLS